MADDTAARFTRNVPGPLTAVTGHSALSALISKSPPGVSMHTDATAPDCGGVPEVAKMPMFAVAPAAKTTSVEVAAVVPEARMMVWVIASSLKLVGHLRRAGVALPTVRNVLDGLGLQRRDARSDGLKLLDVQLHRLDFAIRCLALRVHLRFL